MFKLIVFSCLFFVLNQGCVFAKHKQQHEASQKSQSVEKRRDPKVELLDTLTNNAKVKVNWQRNFFDILLSNQEYESFWGLFSSSGYSDSGQYMVFRKKGHNQVILFHVSPSGKDILGPLKINELASQTFLDQIKIGSKLAAQENRSMDGVQYEYLEGERKNGEDIVIKNRFTMNNPGIDPASKEHARLVEVILKLKQAEE